MEKNINTISIIVPTYEMYGMGADFLRKNFNSIVEQTHQPFEVVVPDNSDDDTIAKVCDEYVGKLPIKYFKNPSKGMAQNTSAGVKAATGAIIKILYMDDRFANKNAIENLVKAFTTGVAWVATGCLHDENGAVVRPHMPSYNHDIYAGNNTIGSPSVVAFVNKDVILMDESMTWLLDCDLYARMYKLHGAPKFIYSCDVVIGIGKHQTTNALSDALKENERQYMLKKVI